MDAGRDLVARWRAGTGAAAAGPAPLTTAQRGVLVFERLCPGTGVFTLHFAALHAGELDERRLDHALSVLVERHPALRARFADGPGGPARTLTDDARIAVQWVDLRGLPAAERRPEALERAARAAARPFDVMRGPLLAVHGARLADDERLLVFMAHHLVCDGGSFRVLLGELDAAYRGELSGVRPDPAPAPGDPAALPHWLTRLADLPELDLPTDRVRPAQPTFRAGSVPLALPADLVARAEELARSEGTTLFTVVLAAFQLLLGVHAGQTDFAVGSPEAGRSQPGRHGAVGLLSDMLVLRADLGGRPSFRELVRRVRATFLDAYAHRGVPFEDLVAALAPGHSVDGSLVRAGFAFQGDWGSPTLAGAPLRHVTVARPGLRYDVDLHLWRADGGLHGTWDFRTEAFDPATAERMARLLPVLLARGLAEPDAPTTTLDLLTDEDRALLDGWGRGPRPDDPDVALTELVARQVARTPDAVAVEDARRALTYRALDERSARLAHLLRERGVAAGDVVGMRLGRSVDLAVAMLGIMRAGAAYLPLDPVYPADRTGFMLRDSGAQTVVTDADLTDLDRYPASGSGLPEVAPDQLAYVLYTSGSTGRPKGALITHRNTVPMVCWGRRTFRPEHLARVLASTSVSFDVSVFEFFAPLCAGGTVVVVDNALSLLADPPDVAMVCAVPSAARALVEAGALPRSTRVVALGGEAVTGTLVDDLYATGHVEAVVNCYGPTEDTTYSTTAVLHPGEQPPPIGTLLAHGRGHVLDGGLRRVPVGAVGELYLAGRGLSDGYANRPGLTAARYVADPFADEPGGRVYRTGDMARYRADGALLYLGRRDFQVKVRGQRIELGEIETTLLRHPQVADAVVALQDGRLVGYLRARRPDAIDLDDVRAHLRRGLPVVMVPSSLVVLDALPQTPNGKVDRLALPAPDVPVAPGGDPPRGPDEELVAEVWRHVLDLPSVGRDDDFFDLGGDSLTAGEVLGGLRERAGRGLSLRLVFENSRLADLAAALPRRGTSLMADGVSPRAPDAAPVLSFEQQRTWLESQFTSGSAYTIHGRQWLRGPLDAAVLERSLRAVVARHESLRTTFPVTGGLPRPQVAEPDPAWRLRVKDLSGPGSGGAGAAEALADAEAAAPFDLARGPLLRCLLVRCGDTEHLLSLTVHHIVADGHSVGLVLRELSALYAAGGDTERAGLTPPPVQYRDYAVAQRAALTPERLTAPIAYWRDRLAGAPPALALPSARRLLPGRGRVGGVVCAALGADDAAALRKLCRVHGVTPFTAVLAALTTVLHRWSGQDEVVVGVPVSTRAAAGTDAMVGLFVNTVPLRVDLAGGPAFSELLDRVRRTAVEGCATHGEVPFEILVRELRVDRDPVRTPLFQVALTMVEDADEQWNLPGVEVTAPGRPPQPSKFDLDLGVHRVGDGYRLELAHDAARYAETSVRTLLDHVTAVLTAAADDPSRRVAEYDLPSPHDDAPPPVPPAALTGADRLAVLATGPLADLAGEAALAVPDAATAADPDATVAWLRDTAATAVHLTGPRLRAMEPPITWVDEAGPVLPDLRHAFLDHRGDLTAHDVARIRRLAPGARVVAVHRSPVPGAPPLAAHEVPAGWTPSSTPLRVPLGRELGGPALTVRTTAGRPAATGEVGELCRDGAGTGLLVRRRPDGVLEAAAPTDGPDLMELVAVLRDDIDVRDAVVTAEPGADGRPELTAHLACRGARLDHARLRQRLVSHLPGHLVPARIVALERLPLTADGDHDLAALTGGRP